MPATPFSPEHDALAASVRRMVDGPLSNDADVAEGGGSPFGSVIGRCNEVGLFDLGDDALAATAAALELGRIRSAGLTRVVLDTMLAASIGLDPVDDPVAVAPDATVALSAGVASGHLPFVAGGGFAERLLVLESAVLIDLRGPGASTQALVAAHALRGSAPAAITLDGAACSAVPADPSAVARWELALAAAAVGAAWQAWHDARDYAQQREAFGRPIGRFQVNRHALADAAARLTAAEALVHDTAHALSQGRADDTAVPLLYATSTAAQVADRALQLHGGNGYTTAFDVSRFWRDAREGRARSDAMRGRVTREARR